MPYRLTGSQLMPFFVRSVDTARGVCVFIVTSAHARQFRSLSHRHSVVAAHVITQGVIRPTTQTPDLDIHGHRTRVREPEGERKTLPRRQHLLQTHQHDVDAAGANLTI